MAKVVYKYYSPNDNLLFPPCIGDFLSKNHQNNAYRAHARELLTCERGLFHRSNRPIEPEAVFGNLKFNHGFKRFRLKSNRKVNVEFGLVAVTLIILLPGLRGLCKKLAKLPQTLYSDTSNAIFSKKTSPGQLRII